jgi:hypothetical protein
VLSACAKLSVPLFTALSLRRHVMKQRLPYLSEAALNLGSSTQKKHSADAFEDAVASFLASEGVSFLTEKQQARVNAAGLPPPQPGVKHPGTPDFLFPSPLLLAPPGSPPLALSWLEIKHFYGASSIDPDGRSAVGKIPQKAAAYKANFGNGAFLFAYGCGAEFKRRLPQGVLVLDSSHLDMTETHRRMALYCRNTGVDGPSILP